MPGMAGFNDLVTDDEGAILVGALRFRPMAGDAPVPGEVWRIPPRRAGEPVPILDGVVWPNGIGLSPDAATLYVSDFSTGAVLTAAADGTGRRELCRVPDGCAPDGLAVDAGGDLWVALGPGGAVARFTPDGDLRERHDVPGADFVSSVCFDGDDLLVATAGALLRWREVGATGRPVVPATV